MSAKDGRLIWLNVTVKDVLARYDMGETVGVGGFAVVKKGRDKQTGQTVAIKVVDKWRYAGEESSEREIRILSQVQHENCIQMHAVFVTGRRVYIVTDLVSGGELLDKVNQRGMFSEPEAAHLTRQVLSGVHYLHQKGIVHRDLKLENILLDEDRQACMAVKIADFGLSKVFSPSTTLSTVCGSPLYMAPELLTVEQQGEYSPAVDVWSVGVICFILLAGYSPFEDANDAVLFEKIKSGKYDDGDPIWDSISDGAKDLVSKMLNVDVTKRPDAGECLQHPWLVEQAQLHESRPTDAAAAAAAASAKAPTARQLASVSKLLSSRVMQRMEVEKAAAGTDTAAPVDAAQAQLAAEAGTAAAVTAAAARTGAPMLPADNSQAAAAALQDARNAMNSQVRNQIPATAAPAVRNGAFPGVATGATGAGQANQAAQQHSLQQGAEQQHDESDNDEDDDDDDEDEDGTRDLASYL